MGLFDFDEMKNKGEELMQNPDTRAKIEQMAKDHGISMDEAKQRFMGQQNQQQNDQQTGQQQ